MRKNRIKYAFVSNIIEIKDVRLEAFYPILGRMIPLFIWKIILLVKALCGKGYSCVASYDTFGQATGYTILIELTAEQYVSKRWLKLAKKVTLKACLYAQNELGVDIIGLGSLTKSITGEGRHLKQNGIDVAVTHGDSYTVASAIEGIEKMITQFKIRNPVVGSIGEGAVFNRKPVVSVIGAYGKIGRALTLMLVDYGYEVIAMARDTRKLKKLLSESNNRIIVTNNLKYALDESQIAVTVTSATFSIITENVLTRNRIYYLYDLGQPYNLFPETYGELIKKDYQIIRVDGGFVGVDKRLDIGFWMRLDKGYMYACFVETILQALEGDLADHVGLVDIDYVRETKQRAEKWGFKHQPLSCYNSPLKKVIAESLAIQKERMLPNYYIFEEKVASCL